MKLFEINQGAAQCYAAYTAGYRETSMGLAIDAQVSSDRLGNVVRLILFIQTELAIN